MTHRTPNPRTILERARRGKYAVGAFNTSNISVLKAIVQAAQKLRAPVIIETSSGETKHLGADYVTAAIAVARRESRVPILANLDHAQSYPAILDAMNAGYDMVHFDGSELPLATNRRICARVVREAHRRGVTVEGEPNHITGSSEWHRATRMASEQKKGNYTDPDAALAFVQATGIDILASFIGNVHGVFQDEESLDIKRLRALRSTVPCFLSLHGGSGIKPSHIRRAVAEGITKINVNTELRIAYIAALRRVLLKQKNEIAPYKLMPPVIAAVQKVVEQKIRLFGSAGKL